MLDDAESMTLVERDVARSARLEYDRDAAFTRVLEPELDERGADPLPLPAWLDRDGVELPNRLGRKLRCDPTPQAMVPTSSVIRDIWRQRIVDLSECVVPRACLLGRHEYEGTVSVCGLPDDPQVHERLEIPSVRANAAFLEVVRPSAEWPRHRGLGDEGAAEDVREMSYPARISRTDLHHRSSLDRATQRSQRVGHPPRFGRVEGAEDLPLVDQ
jgi:hypothetical protein